MGGVALAGNARWRFSRVNKSSRSPQHCLNGSGGQLVEDIVRRLNQSELRKFPIDQSQLRIMSLYQSQPIRIKDDV